MIELGAQWDSSGPQNGVAHSHFLSNARFLHFFNRQESFVSSLKPRLPIAPCFFSMSALAAELGSGMSEADFCSQLSPADWDVNIGTVTYGRKARYYPPHDLEGRLMQPPFSIKEALSMLP